MQPNRPRTDQLDMFQDGGHGIIHIGAEQNKINLIKRPTSHGRTEQFERVDVKDTPMMDKYITEQIQKQKRSYDMHQPTACAHVSQPYGMEIRYMPTAERASNGILQGCFRSIQFTTTQERRNKRNERWWCEKG